jgi:RecB family endonuclease NucS
MKKRLNGQTLEIDVLVTNENHVLVVEVKSSLGVNDVKDLMDDLRRFREFFPEYAQKQLYGAVAGIEIEEGADKYAYRQGLFVLAQAGEAVSILNNPDFEPRNW